MSTILVTGAAGFIGSQIVHTLHRMFDQPRIIGLDNLTGAGTCPLPSGVECMFGEIGDRRFITNLINKYKITHVLHQAAHVVVPESVDKPLAYYRNNMADTLELIGAAGDAGCRFVFASTAAVYGEIDMRVALPRHLQEDDACNPLSPYGQSKLMVEQVLEDYFLAQGMPAVILRYFNVAGADPLGLTGPCTEHTSYLIPRVVRAGLGLTPTLFVNGDGGDKRDYVHVADVARANMAALAWLDAPEQPATIGVETVNVGRGYAVTVSDVIAEVERQLGNRVSVTPARRREGDPRECVADIKRIKTLFNWEPQYGLEEIVEHAIQWERKKLPQR